MGRVDGKERGAAQIRIQNCLPSTPISFRC